MKQHWETEELIDYWLLLPSEQELLATKTGATKLGFAVLLKFFQLESYFPRTKGEVSLVVLEFLAKQIQVEPQSFLDYDLQGRTATYHRTQIREIFGYREATAADGERLSRWLVETVLPSEPADKLILEAISRQCREWRIEPPSSERIERLTRSAKRSYEDAFCHRIQSRLSPETRELLDGLLLPETETVETSTTLNEPAETISVLTWRILKTAPGGANAESMLAEIKRLTFVRSLRLPHDLFLDVPRKVMQGLRRRAAIEEPYELRRHPAPLRRTLLAAFCFIRTQEITDTLVDLLIEIVHRLGAKAERRVEREFLAEFKRVGGKNNLLFKLAEVALEQPEGTVKGVVYPIIPEQTLRDLVKEDKLSGNTYREKVTTVLRNSYRG